MSSFSVITDPRDVAVWTNDGDVLGIFVQRQKTAFIFQQAHGLPRRFQRQIRLRSRFANSRIDTFIHERMIKQPEHEFRAQHPPDGLIQSGLESCPFFKPSTMASRKTL